MRAFSIILVATLLVGCAGDKVPAWVRGASKQQSRWGHYSGYVEARWENDGRTMTLLSELRYTDPDGVVWIAPAGSVVDGASIPRSLWSLMGGPFEGRYRNASVLHDVAYDQHNKPWPVCDQMFYNAMRCSGVGAVEAGTMYYGLRKFGRHWKHPKAEPVKVGEDIVARAEPVNQGDINATRNWIRSSAPNLQQIEQRAAAASDGSH
ncbi:MAG TPA: DUF1353 domain-containing protein [Chthoniobacterales bacterium]|nr:DUF1353 domain-containing protein [Chthoniobacterales bacterium]